MLLNLRNAGCCWLNWLIVLAEEISMIHETIIRGGNVIDGPGQPSKRVDIAIDYGRISRIVELSEETAGETRHAS